MATIFKLIEKDTLPFEVKYRGKTFIKNEERFTYQADNGDMLQFHGDPNRPFVWVFGKKSNAGGLSKNKAIITAFVKAGMDQHQYIGGFDEAVATLIIK